MPPEPAPAQETHAPIPNGIDAATGRPLPGLDLPTLQGFAAEEAQPPLSEQISRARGMLAEGDFGVVGDVTDPNDLAQTGWGVVFPADVDPAPLQDALKPLLDRRQAQCGAGPFKVFAGGDGVRPTDTVLTWLARHGASMNVVDPLNGVPYYLLLVGSPQEIPFAFQYTLDIYWAVGRLHFPTVDAYRSYAERVVAYEGAAAPLAARKAALFATRHEFDLATQLFADRVAAPLIADTPPRGVLGASHGFAWESIVGDAATKDALRALLRGQSPGGPPALLLTGSHGVAMPHADPGFGDGQGALVCQDWPGEGAITPDHWFGASDLAALAAEAQVEGLIHVFFACYSAGSPQWDTFARFQPPPTQRAPQDVVSRLPQALLERGALATLGHVDRAWSYSFQTDRSVPQLQGFRDVIARIFRGDRLGQATDQFNVRWAALSTDLAEAIVDSPYDPNLQKLANSWIARDDARNYVILGDPAVRLRLGG